MSAIGICFDHVTLQDINGRYRVTLRDVNGEAIDGHWYDTETEALKRKAEFEGFQGFIPVQDNNWRQQGWR